MSCSTSSSSPRRVKVAILGATGVVGQKFISLLCDHPWFEVVALAASERSAGQTFGSLGVWKLSTPLPPSAVNEKVVLCSPAALIPTGAQVAFSALDASVAGEVEDELAKAGIKVFSNARNHRYDPDVPILIPHANPEHLSIIHHQQQRRGFTKGGYIVTNANCSSTGLVVVLRPLQILFGIESLVVVTLQAISGAGYPGVSALDITDNVVPYISGEEPKLEKEPQKILGDLSSDATSFIPADFRVSAHCNRVNTIDGHMECVSIKFKKSGVTPEQVVSALREYQSEAQHLKLPSAPAFPISVLDVDNRPQPRLDRDAGKGMTVTVGRVRKCELFDVKLALCSHNTVIGAAGGSIQNAELAYAKQWL